MANLKDIRPAKVTMILGYKEREIKFDLNAFAELEKRFGSVENAMQKMQSGGMGSIKTILWTGLIHEEAVLDEETGEPIKYNITPFQVGGWITMRNLEEVSGKLSQAMGADLPEAKAADLQKEIAQLRRVDGNTPTAQVATVVPTDEEKAEEEKNG